VQGGSNMNGTNLYVNKCKQSRSYLNHLVWKVDVRSCWMTSGFCRDVNYISALLWCYAAYVGG